MFGGGFGIIPEDKDFYAKLSKIPNTHYIIISGHNKKLYNSLKQNINFENISILGYSDKIYEILSKSDILITKPGGITLFEAIMLELPCLLLKPKLGQEIENCKFVADAKIGYIVNNADDIIRSINKMRENKKIIKHCKYNMKLIKDNINIDKLPKKINKLIKENLVK